MQTDLSRRTDRCLATISLADARTATLSVPGLAMALSEPALADGLRTRGPWEDLRLERPGRALFSAGGPSGAAFGPALAADAVAESIGAHDRVAVLFTGTAAERVLVAHAAATCQADGRDLLVVVPEGAGPPEASSRAIAALPLLARLARGVDIQLVEPSVLERSPAWRPAGPATAQYEVGLPAALHVARDWNAGVVLVGGGADEVFARAHYPGRDLARALVRGVPPAVVAGLAARAYRTTCAGSLAEPHRQAVIDASAEWRAGRLACDRQGWMAAVGAAAADRCPLAGQPWYDDAGDALPPVAAPLLQPALIHALTRTGSPATAVQLVPLHLTAVMWLAPSIATFRPAPWHDLPLMAAAGLVERVRIPALGSAQLSAALSGIELWLRPATK
jgi:hypothetical protein